MGKTKQDYLIELVLVAFKMDEKATKQHERTVKMQRMATLSRQGLKNTEEFKSLNMQIKNPCVTDFSDEIKDLQKIVKRLKKYKWNEI